MADRQEEPATEAHVYDTRALTDDQRSLADDIASAMGWGHEEICDVWSEDSDGCSCPLLQAVADGLAGAHVVEIIQEFGYDTTTRRGDRLHRQPFRPHPLSVEREAQGEQPAPLDVEGLERALRTIDKPGSWASVIIYRRDELRANYARLSNQPSTEPAQGGTE